MPKHYLAWTLAWVLCLAPAVSIAQPASGSWQPGLADYSAMTLLAGAQDALSNLQSGQSSFQNQIFITSALSSLSALYQLHGCEWAIESLMPLYTEPDCPDIHFGYSIDGRVRLTVEPLELQNPALKEYMVLLVTVESNSGTLIRAANPGMVIVEMHDGTKLYPQQLDPNHELWERLKRLADTFNPPPYLNPGGSTAFKQIYGAKDFLADNVIGVSLEWDGYTISVPYYENLAVFQK